MILPRDAQPAASVGSEFGNTPDTKPHPRLDSIGVFWITFAGIWTGLLLGGMWFLWSKREMPTLRIRGLPLSFAGIVLLHLYWISVQIGYSVGPLAPEVAEFWIMSIWYPFGIALFQAANSQFLHVAKAQSKFARPPSVWSNTFNEKSAPRKETAVDRLRNMDYSKRMFMFVTIGMIVQLVVVVFIYLISRKFHASFGIAGTEVTGKTPMEIAMKQGRGWEWWPSLFWQFFWAWVIAPVILWQSRGIHDTHGWKLQTVVCCIAGLPAAPMWLIALYVPGMAPVNAYFVPPQWIALSIFVIEIFTVFVPCWQVRRHQNLRQETLESIAHWESKNKTGAETGAETGDDTTPPLSPTSTKVGFPTSLPTISSDSWKKLPNVEREGSLSAAADEGVLTMSALEHVLSKNPEPLRQFSARRDFSGENIAFLTAVAEWKAALPPAFVRNRHNTADEVVRQQFTRALRIYTEFISPRDAEFPINIAWHELRKLEGIFERAARSMFGGSARRTDSATPFADVDWRSSTSPAPASHNGSEMNIVLPSTTTNNNNSSRTGSDGLLAPPSPGLDRSSSSGGPGVSTETLVLSEKEIYKGDVPHGFDASVFDAAQQSIKYLVLTNTWPKYVKERRNSEDSQGSRATAETYETTRSKSSLQRYLSFLRPMIRY